ncbi:microtubule-associated protein 70-2-like isoform X1 [Aristolochia californica]|uniref:microtubule-associated protein 70-2-like isoform X1 n=1 Tax=Aristolochia californica TaxID=171875 RepID=UPI0035D718FE
MAEISGEGDGLPATSAELTGRASAVEATATSTPSPAPSPLMVSASFKEGKGGSRRRTSKRPSMEADEFMNLLHGSDPVKVELNRLENEVRDKDRELGEAQAEIRALRLSERLREKAVEELTEELEKVEEKLKLTESLLENRVMLQTHHFVSRGYSDVIFFLCCLTWRIILQNLEIKKINDEKKASMAAQFAAEATLRRVHAAQKDDDMPPIEAILAPLEAELKLARQEISKLQDDNKALDRVTKSKEAALLEEERTVQMALAKASMVDDLQNKNQELMKQIEICQEENKILDKMHRQKVAEVEKLSQTVRELEEAVLAGGAAANAVRDYQRKVQEMNDERKTLDRELARAKVTANRVATVVANEWKDANDKVMPVKQWLEDRRFMQGEMQQLREKLAIVERAVKSEAQLKEKYQLRLKVMEEGLRPSSNGSGRSTPEGRSLSNGPSRRQSFGGAENISKLSSNGFLSKRTSASQLRSSLSSGTSSILKHAKGTSKSFDGGTRSLDRGKVLLNGIGPLNKSSDASKETEKRNTWKENPDEKPNENSNADPEDYVSGLLYDMLQKEVISLRKACHEKDQSLKDKDDAIEMLAKKVETLTKAMEVEAKKMRREVAAMEKEVAAMRVDKEHESRAKRLVSSSKASINSSSQMLPGRTVSRTGSMRNLQ